jgi:hypothetical protein
MSVSTATFVPRSIGLVTLRILTIPIFIVRAGLNLCSKTFTARTTTKTRYPRAILEDYDRAN